MKITTIFACVALLLVSNICFAQNRSVTATVKDIKTNEGIPYCTVILIKADTHAESTLSDINGDFTINIAAGDMLKFSHVSYESKTIIYNEQSSLIQFLTPKLNAIDAVTVYSSFKPTNQGSIYTYTPQQAGSSISIIGEPDVLRHISSLPGVSQGIEGSLGLFVRGGNSGSNGIYFNDVPIYSSSHLIGLFSSFPADIIDQTTFYMGGMPACFGNLSSSLLKITPKKSYNEPRFKGKATISPYLTGFYSIIPLVKSKLAVQFDARASFLPFLMNRV